MNGQTAAGLALFASIASIFRYRAVHGDTNFSLSKADLGSSFRASAASSSEAAAKGGKSDDGCTDCSKCDDAVDPMVNSVKKYDRHVLICDERTDWPKRIENDSAEFPYNLVNLIGAAAQQKALSTSMDFTIKVTACDYIESQRVSEESTKRCIIVYPDNLIFYVDDAQLESFAKFVCNTEPLTSLTHFAKELEEFCSVVPSWERLVLVCVHGSRDKRCGRAGPQVIEQLKAELKTPRFKNADGDVAVHGCSHIGGHAFAGTCIVYPQGDWYGRLSKSNAGVLLDHIVSGSIFEKGWRGNGFKQLNIPDVTW